MSSFQVVNKLAYKEDKVCSVRGCVFGILGASKKHFCKFCYRGVCGKCSSRQDFHADLGKAVRFCDSCFSRRIKDSVESAHVEDLRKAQDNIRKLQETLVAERLTVLEQQDRRASLLNRLEGVNTYEKEREHLLREDISNLQEEIPILRDKHLALSEQVDQYSLAVKDKDEILGRLTQVTNCLLYTSDAADE